jgi:hypothetical protein
MAELDLKLAQFLFIRLALHFLAVLRSVAVLRHHHPLQ